MQATEEITVWLDDEGAPARVVWEGRRYRVTDMPTRLEFDWALITHPPKGLPEVMWKFQGTDEDGDSLLFDIGLDETAGGWRVRHVYNWDGRLG